MTEDKKPREYYFAKNQLHHFVKSVEVETYPHAFECLVLKSELEKAQAEIARLKKIIAKELSENDELGCEYTYVNVLRDEIAEKDREIVELMLQLNAYKNGNGIKEIHYDEHLGIELAEKDREIKKLNLKCSMLESTLKSTLRTISENQKLKEKCDDYESLLIDIKAGKFAYYERDHKSDGTYIPDYYTKIEELLQKHSKKEGGL